jgi:hypothetical protein
MQDKGFIAVVILVIAYGPQVAGRYSGYTE